MAEPNEKIATAVMTLLTNDRDHAWISAKDIMQSIKKTNTLTANERRKLNQKPVNQFLYAELKRGRGSRVERMDGPRPTWREARSAMQQQFHVESIPEAIANEPIRRTLVVIDLGNVHDCLQPMLALVVAEDTKDVNVLVYADRNCTATGGNAVEMLSIIRDTDGMPTAVCEFDSWSQTHIVVNMTYGRKFAWTRSESGLKSAADVHAIVDLGAALANKQPATVLIASCDNLFSCVSEVATRYNSENAVHCVRSWNELREYVE